MIVKQKGWRIYAGYTKNQNDECLSLLILVKAIDLYVLLTSAGRPLKDGWLRLQAGMMGGGPIPDHILRMQMQRLHLQAMTMGGVQQAGLMMPGAPMPGAMPMPMGPYGHLPHMGIPAMGMPGEPLRTYEYTHKNPFIFFRS